MVCRALSVLARTSYSAAALCGLVFACGNEPPAEPVSPPVPVPISEPSPPAVPEPVPDAVPEPEPLVIEAFAAGENEGAALAKIHSLPAWSAALERYRLLARRGQSGPIHGVLAESETGPRLVDETVGDGALSIPVALPNGVSPELPMRAVLWGAWKPEKPDTGPSWRWHATRVQSLAPATEPIATVPAFEPLKAPIPADAVLASKAPRRGGTISFVVKRQSNRAGDGWLIADDNKGKPVARLLLPGERETYGDQSTLVAEERWKLGRNTRYWLTIRSYRAAQPGDLPVLRARSAPYWDRKASAAPAKAPVP